MRFLTFFCVQIFIFTFSQNFAQNLIQNGAFEFGGPGNGFIVDGAGYTMLTPPFTGTTVNGNYAFATNPILVNSEFISTGDNTTGSGIMMIIDGNTTGGQQRFYKAGDNGGGVCGLTVGQTYTFFYWIRGISTNSNTFGTRANIGVQFNNVSSSQIESGSTLAPLPNNGWQQVVYSFVPNNNCVNIELFNNNTSAVGNNFAIDDVTVVGPPNSVQFAHSIVQAGCGSPTNAIAIYAKGGTAPYTYDLSGAAISSNTTGLFDNLIAGTYNITVTDANGSSISQPNVVVSENTSSGILTQDTTICAGETVELATVNPVNLNDWVSTPNDPSLQTINNTTFSASPDETTTYSLGVSGPTNLIYNGSFQLGATGFFTQYELIATNNNVGQGVAGVTANSQAWFNPFDSCTDQDGTNTMLVADAATTPNTIIWRQTVPVQPNTNYTFSYWATSVVNISPAQLQVIINGTNVNSTTLTTNTCFWQNITMTWNSGAATTATIDIINNNLAANGNDFAIDNLSFTSEDNCDVTVTVIPTTPLDIPATHTFCTGETINLSVSNATNLIWETPSGTTINSDNLSIPNAQAIHAGVYTVSAAGGGTDCPNSGQTEVIIVPGPSVNTTVQNVLCFGEQNGSATANVTGNGPFQFAWSTGGSTQTINNLAPQNYSVQVTDANGCISEASATIGEPEALQVLVSTTDTDCDQAAGTATASVSGGVGSYSYSWSNGATGQNVTNLAQGNYTVVVTDGNGCSVTQNFTILTSNGPNVTIQSTTDVSCFGLSDGQASIEVTGGSPPYIFNWTPDVNNSGNANNLSAGSYQVEVIDQAGCSNLISFDIGQPDSIALSSIVSNPTCGLQNGSIEIQITGGLDPYEFEWTPDIGDTNDINNLSAGNYNVVVQDANGCSSSASINLVTEGNIPLSVNASSLVINIGDSANLIAFVGGGIQDFDITWFPSDNLSCSTCQSTMAGPSEDTNYSVTVTTSDGCSASASIFVAVEIPCGAAFLPTIFSPNQDGLNDEYCVLGSCLESMEFAIFNRWGERVFYSNSQSKCWDGKFRGKDVPQGVYAYKFISTEANGKTTITSGNINVVR